MLMSFGVNLYELSWGRASELELTVIQQCLSFEISIAGHLG
jgi:hypothetical protein